MTGKPPTDPSAGDNPEVDQGPFDDTRPKEKPVDPRTGGSRPQEKVEDRANVSTVTPEDYPQADRDIANPGKR